LLAELDTPDVLCYTKDDADITLMIFSMFTVAQAIL